MVRAGLGSGDCTGGGACRAVTGEASTFVAPECPARRRDPAGGCRCSGRWRGTTERRLRAQIDRLFLDHLDLRRLRAVLTEMPTGVGRRRNGLAAWRPRRGPIPGDGHAGRLLWQTRRAPIQYINMYTDPTRATPANATAGAISFQACDRVPVACRAKPFSHHTRKSSTSTDGKASSSTDVMSCVSVRRANLDSPFVPRAGGAQFLRQ